jgi:hypothetical protein
MDLFFILAALTWVERKAEVREYGMSKIKTTEV